MYTKHMTNKAHTQTKHKLLPLLRSNVKKTLSETRIDFVLRLTWKINVCMNNIVVRLYIYKV